MCKNILPSHCKNGLGVNYGTMKVWNVFDKIDRSIANRKITIQSVENKKVIQCIS